ncbi:MAG: hypothetical protein OWR52_03420 [Acidibacillus sp.]|nr:hypothetical protein [Acidibacillus sp.]
MRLQSTKNHIQRRRSRRPQAYVMLLVGAMVVFLLWVVLAADPFQTTNPFLRQTTIGQSVLGDWRYGGDSAAGIKFYDAYQAVVLPPGTPTFAADGQFVKIDGTTPSTITFEPAYESETIGPAVFLWLALFIAAGIVAFRQGQSRIGKQQKKFRRPSTKIHFRK